MKRKNDSEPEGNTKEPILRSMYVACSTEKVVIWEYTVQNRMHVDQMGSNLIIIFTSSTWFTVDAIFMSCSGLDVEIIAALSRYLCACEKKENCYSFSSIWKSIICRINVWEIENTILINIGEIKNIWLYYIEKYVKWFYLFIVSAVARSKVQKQCFWLL